jgi:hypothetical protein
MNMRETSLEAYREVHPKLPESRRAIYACIKMHSSHNRINGAWAKGATNAEISFLTGKPVNTVTPRTNELVKGGYVGKVVVRKCRVTGFNAVAWAVQAKQTVETKPTGDS